MGDCFWVRLPEAVPYLLYVTSHLAFYPLWDGKMSISFRAE